MHFLSTRSITPAVGDEDSGSAELAEVLPAVAGRDGGTTRTIELHEKSLSAESKAGTDPRLLSRDPGNTPDPAVHP